MMSDGTTKSPLENLNSLYCRILVNAFSDKDEALEELYCVIGLGWIVSLGLVGDEAGMDPVLLLGGHHIHLSSSKSTILSLQSTLRIDFDGIEGLVRDYQGGRLFTGAR